MKCREITFNFQIQMNPEFPFLVLMDRHLQQLLGGWFGLGEFVHILASSTFTPLSFISVYFPHISFSHSPEQMSRRELLLNKVSHTHTHVQQIMTLVVHPTSYVLK